MPTRQARPDKWLTRTPSPDSSARLFCIPYSGCGASMYRNWPVSVGGLEICPVQLPGRENRMREKTFTSYESLADELADGLLPYLDRPYGFFGHCSSALAAYEAVVRLEQRGQCAPERLFVSSQVAPHQGPYGRFLELTTVQLRQEIHRMMEGLGATPVPGLVDLTLEILQSDIQVNRDYRVAEPVALPCPVTVIGWDQDVEVPAELMAGWSAYGTAVTELLHGEHYGFMEAPLELLDVFVRDLVPADRPGVLPR